MTNTYKLIDIWYFLSMFLFNMINFSFGYEKIKENEKNGKKEVKWISLGDDSNGWGWIDDWV